MQASQRLGFIRSIEQYGHVMIAATVGYHPDRDMLHCLQYTRGIAVLFGAEIAHHANNGLILIDIHRAEAQQFFFDLGEVSSIVDS